MMRVYNFSAGPSVLPESVLRRAADEMMSYNGSGMSVMEMSHRSKVYEPIITGTKAKLRELMQIPDDYEILFLQGGASTQFAAIPLNLMTKNQKADYVVTGQFSKKSAQEAAKFGDVTIVASSEDKNNAYIPVLSEEDFTPDADYVHICMNNTIFGTKWNYIPKTPSPLVADVSSCILSEPIDVTKFGLLYAGAQKNMAPAGLTVVIVRRDLLGNQSGACPTMLNYKTMADNDSMYNTPPCYCIYIMGLVLDWIKDEFGSLEGIAVHNREKAAILYDYLDSQSFYKAPAEKEARSIMNVTFSTKDAALDAEFVKEAEKAGLVNLKGHRSVGGMRASIYNAMPKEGVQALVAFMKAFAESHSKEK